MMINSTKG